MLEALSPVRTYGELLESFKRWGLVGVPRSVGHAFEGVVGFLSL